MSEEKKDALPMNAEYWKPVSATNVLGEHSGIQTETFIRYVKGGAIVRTTSRVMTVVGVSCSEALVLFVPGMQEEDA